MRRLLVAALLLVAFLLGSVAMAAAVLSPLIVLGVALDGCGSSYVGPTAPAAAPPDTCKDSFDFSGPEGKERLAEWRWMGSKAPHLARYWNV